MWAVAALAVMAALGSVALALAGTGPPGPPAASAAAAPAGAPSVTWGKPARVAGSGDGGLGAVSCPAAADCLAIDRYGDGVAWNGRRWSAPAAAIRGAAGIASLSCPSAGFCAAAGNSLWTGHGTRWTRYGPPLGGDWDSVSCTSATFCAAATAGGYVSQYNGRGWSAPVQIDVGAPGSMTVSCASAASCFAMDGYGAFYAWNGTRWAGAAGYDKYALLACSPGRFCMVLDDQTVHTFNGSSWSVSGSGPLAEGGYLSCGSATFCMLLSDSRGTAAAYNGKGWRQFAAPVLTLQAGPAGFRAALACARQTCAAVAAAPASTANVYRSGAWAGQVRVDDSGELDSVSCPAAGFCAAVGMAGWAVTSRAGHWARPAPLPGALGASSVSCPSATFCLAVDLTGHAWRYTGTRWVSAPTPKQSGPYLAMRSVVSCVSPRFCAWAGDGLAVFNGTRWTTPALVPPFFWTAIGCQSPVFCMAGDEQGEVSVFNGKVWSAPAAIVPGSYSDSIWAISCPSARFCAAVTDSGGAATFNGATWAYATITTGQLSGVSCVSGRLCVSADQTGHAYTFNGTQWSGPANMQLRADATQEAVSCAPARLCVAVDSQGDATTGT